MQTTLEPPPEKPFELPEISATAVEVLAYSNLLPAFLGTIMTIYYIFKCCKPVTECIKQKKCEAKTIGSTLFPLSATVATTCLLIYFNQNKRNPSNMMLITPMALSIFLCLTALIAESTAACTKTNSEATQEPYQHVSANFSKK